MFICLDKPINILFQSGNENKYIAVVGENVTITWKAEGVPAPNYIILHNGTTLNTTSVVNGVTTIKSVQRCDEGQYQCTACNFLGNTNASFDLIVHGRIFLNPLLSNGLPLFIKRKFRKIFNFFSLVACSYSTRQNHLTFLDLFYNYVHLWMYNKCWRST